MANLTNPDLGASLLAGDCSPNFLPCPKISLFVDPNILGSCGICHVKLEFRSQEETAMTGAEVTIVPCGHLACYTCMTMCLQTKPECPFCRLSLTYELCSPSHSIKLCRAITKESLFSLPDTIPMGGKVADQCHECRILTNKLTSEGVLGSFAEVFKVLRKQYQEADESAKRAMQGKIQRMQQQFQCVTNRLSSQAVAALGGQW